MLPLGLVGGVDEAARLDAEPRAGPAGGNPVHLGHVDIPARVELNAGSVLCTSKCSPLDGWVNCARSLSGRERVSRGTLDGSSSITKQSSISGSVGCMINGFVTSVSVNCSTLPTGIPLESMGRYLLVNSCALVPSIVGPPEMLK